MRKLKSIFVLVMLIGLLFLFFSAGGYDSQAEFSFELVMCMLAGAALIFLGWYGTSLVEEEEKKAVPRYIDLIFSKGEEKDD